MECERGNVTTLWGDLSKESGRASLLIFFLLYLFHMSIQEVETTVVKASVSTPEGGSSIQLVIGITQEPLENPRRDHIYESSPSVMGKAVGLPAGNILCR